MRVSSWAGPSSDQSGEKMAGLSHMGSLVTTVSLEQWEHCWVGLERVKGSTGALEEGWP